MGNSQRQLEQVEAEERGVSVEELRAQLRRDEQALRDRADRDWAAGNRGEWGSDGAAGLDGAPLA